MPRILIIRMSSMGDVIHNLPAVNDIHRQYPDARIDWVVEESFATIVALHPRVSKVVPVALRRWRQSLVEAATRKEISAFKRVLRAESYDIVLDSQGLIKSALLARLARGERHGYDWASAREGAATLLYQRRYAVGWHLHAVQRNRLLTSLALGYDIQNVPLDYGIAAPESTPQWLPKDEYAVLLHATSRTEKLWPEDRWIALGQLLSEARIYCLLPWGTAAERVRGERLAKAIPNARAAPALNLDDAASLLARAAIVIGVDTGLTHLAAALGANVIAVYVASSPGLNGVYAGKQAINLGEAGATPAVSDVWHAASKLMDARP